MNDAARPLARAGLRTRADVTLDIIPRPLVMLTAEIIRWAAVAALTVAAIRFPRPSGFWSLGPRRPLVLARAATDPTRFRAAAQM